MLRRKEKSFAQRGLSMEIRPVFKRVDTCAAEFATTTAYMYSTYEEECEAEPTDKPKIMILGGGPNRIGQGIEFDYCCVHAALALRESGYETIMVNCNPETVSTDYDTSDRLYFESLTFEDVMEIIDKEKPKGVIVQYGGQTPLKLARDLEAAGARLSVHRRTPSILPKIASAFRSWSRTWSSNNHRTGRRVTRKRRLRWGPMWAIRWLCGLPTCLVAGRWKSCMAKTTWPRTWMRQSAYQTTARCCSTGSSIWRSRLTLTRSATANEC